jgi:enterochelin esterase-like enzyme
VRRITFAVAGVAAATVSALLVACSPAGPISPTPTGGAAGTVVSPEVHADGSVTFRLGADFADFVYVTGDVGDVGLRKDDAGVWSGTTGPLEPGIYDYYFSVDGVRIEDPGNPDRNGTKDSLLTVPGHPPMAWEVQDVPRGAVTRTTYESAVVGTERPYLVYTPPGYEVGTDPLPVLYLLHGYTDDESAWIDVGKAAVIADNLLAQGLMEPMIIVMPYGQRSPDALPYEAIGPGFREEFETEVLTEIIPAIEADFRVVPDAKHRAIAGLSMGGMEAAEIGMNHPEVFSTVAMWSAALFDDSATILTRLASLPDDARASFEYVQVAVGTEDDLLLRNAALAGFLTSQGVTIDFRTTPGRHSWLLWRTCLVNFLPEFSAIAA